MKSGPRIDAVYVASDRLHVALNNQTFFSVDFTISSFFSRALRHERLRWELDETRTAIVWDLPGLYERLDLDRMHDHGSFKWGDITDY